MSIQLIHGDASRALTKRVGGEPQDFEFTPHADGTWGADLKRDI